MSNVFLCHRSPDKPLVEKLARALQAAGHTVWFDEWEIQIGDSVPGKISDGLARADHVVLCYSSHGDSSWTQVEWQSTLARQLDGEPVTLLPAFVSGGTVPAILAGMKYADLVKNWEGGVKALLRAIR